MARGSLATSSNGSALLPAQTFDYSLPTNVPIEVEPPHDIDPYILSAMREPFMPPYGEDLPYLYNYTNKTLEREYSVFSYRLLEGGCTIDESSPQEDCLTVCATPGRVLNNLTTLNNCIIAPFVVASLNGTLNHTNADLAAQFGLYPETQIESSYNITNITKTCIQGFMEDKKGDFYCDLNELITREGYVNGSTLTSCYYDMCSNNIGTVDADLGGIGVFVSYLIQLGISLGGFVALHLFTAWTYHIFRWFMGKRRAMGAQTVLSRHRSALLSGLDEFHRTQCFFSGAIQIAAIVVIKDNNFVVQQSLPMLTNYAFIRTVAFNGIITIPFTFWYLKDRIQRSWYKYMLTLVAYVLSVATYAIATWYYKNFNLPSNISGQDFPYCDNVDPTRQCGTFSQSGGNSGIFEIFGDNQAPILPSLFMLYMLVDYLFHRSIRRFFRKMNFWHNYRLEWRKAKNGRQRNKLVVLWFLLFKLPLAVMVIFFYFLQILSLKGFLLDKIDFDDWSFGQVVGVTVWVPPILEFIQLALTGMKEGFAHRLPRGFALTEDSDEEDSATSTERGSSIDSAKYNSGYPLVHGQSPLYSPALPLPNEPQKVMQARRTFASEDSQATLRPPVP